jgi:uncharacterized oxidoreductase
MNLKGNTVLITGGASGIGYALAEDFLKAGSEVIICGRREEKLLEAQKKHPEFKIKKCDAASDAERAELVQWAVSNFKNLNILVNNAGIQRDIDFKKGIAEYKAGPNEIAINLEAPIVLSGMFIPYLTGKEGRRNNKCFVGAGICSGGKKCPYTARQKRGCTFFQWR